MKSSSRNENQRLEERLEPERIPAALLSGSGSGLLSLSQLAVAGKGIVNYIDRVTKIKEDMNSRFADTTSPEAIEFYSNAISSVNSDSILPLVCGGIGVLFGIGSVYLIKKHLDYRNFVKSIQAD